MSVVGSVHAPRAGRTGYSRRTNTHQIAESDASSAFITSASNTGVRRHRGFIRSEVKKSEVTHFDENQKLGESPLSSSGCAPPRSSVIPYTNPQARFTQTSEESSLDEVKSISAHQKKACSSLEDDSEVPSQPSLAQLAAMDAFRFKPKVLKPKSNLRKGRSDNSSVEIVVNKSDEHTSATDHKASCWTRATERMEEEQTSLSWDCGFQDIENLQPAPNLNCLGKRRPHNSQKVEIGMNPTSTVNSRKLLRTDANFPALPSTKEAVTSVKEPGILTIDSSTSAHPTLSDPSPRINSNKKATNSDKTIFTANKMAIPVAKVDNLLEPTAKMIQDIRTKPMGELAPHLRTKAMDKSALVHTVVEVPKSPQSQRNTNSTGKMEMESRIPPHIASARNKSTLTKSGEEGNNEYVYLNPENAVSQASALNPPKTTNLAPVEAEKNATEPQPSQQDTPSGMNLVQHSSVSNPSEKQPLLSSKEFLNLMATQHDEWASSHTMPNPRRQTPSSEITLKRAGISQGRAQDDLPVTSELLAVQEPDRLKGEDKLSDTINSPEPEMIPGSESRLDAEEEIPTQCEDPSHQLSAPSRAPVMKRGNNRFTKDDPWEFPWISGEPKPSLMGWNNKLKPAPIGDEWTMRDPHDPSDAKHKAVIETWASDQLQEQAVTAPVVDVNDPDFLTGRGIVEGDIGLQEAIEASLHDAVPDKSTIHEPKRQLNTEDAIKEHIARHGLQIPEGQHKKQEKRDPMSGLTKSERQANLDFYRAAFKDYKPEPNEHAPEANIYMRPAEVKDIPLITHLHNEHIQNSTTTYFVNPSSVTMWRQILQECIGNRCPFFVAVLSRSQTRVMRAQDIRTGKFESVVGFAYGVDFGEPDNAYRITLEIEIWVDPRYKHQGIGKTLLDRMLTCLDPMYSFKDPAPFLHMGEPEKWMGGGHRIVQTLMVNMLYSDDEKATLEWKKQWLLRNNFQVGGTIPGIGRKFRKQINLCQMYYTTGHDVSHIIQ